MRVLIPEDFILRTRKLSNFSKIHFFKKNHILDFQKVSNPNMALRPLIQKLFLRTFKKSSPEIPSQHQLSASRLNHLEPYLR